MHHPARSEPMEKFKGGGLLIPFPLRFNVIRQPCERGDPMLSPIRISAKTLGSMAMPQFCPHCFWIQMRLQGKLPYQIFPGIFSSIDSYGKKLVHGWFDRHGRAPSWLSGLGGIKGYREPPHFSKFNVLDTQSLVLLSGSPDGVLIRDDNSHMIVDYKTAKFTQTQDELFPMYQGQLNAYAYIGEHCGFSPVSGLALIYTEPVTDAAAAGKDTNMTEDGFVMKFSIHVLPVHLKTEMIPKLMRRAREIHDLTRPPNPSRVCKDCTLLQRLLAVASS